MKMTTFDQDHNRHKVMTIAHMPPWTKQDKKKSDPNFGKFKRMVQNKIVSKHFFIEKKQNITVNYHR